ncbi:TPA: TfoX/Sxy family protein [Staphylococcus aureus]|uniref:TfoX/Sxy family protein n=1 Tax=Staphylococcus coagulans TaxID=74706 RepID=UPI0030ED5EA3|nr:TfoX/Sxy family protein [Staphylococcus aureus]
MSTDKKLHDLFLKNFRFDGIRTRKMMGEYIIYYDDIVIGGLYDNRLLLKVTQSSLSYLPNNDLVSPYQNAKKQILVLDFNDSEKLTKIFKEISEDLKRGG